MPPLRDPLYTLEGLGLGPLGGPYAPVTPREQVHLRPAQPAPQEGRESRLSALTRSTPVAGAVSVIRGVARSRSDAQAGRDTVVREELGPAARYVTMYDYEHPERAPFLGPANVVNPHPPGFPRPAELATEHARRAYGPQAAAAEPRLYSAPREAHELER